ncbi:hypothetical protein D6764_03415 [Candidatus Woesearchaeota archaeon]|nr:MAG: hypothetical protein D6764_03415 [Candidatus Woesearchaeota archaeon]
MSKIPSSHKAWVLFCKVKFLFDYEKDMNRNASVDGDASFNKLFTNSKYEQVAEDLFTEFVLMPIMAHNIETVEDLLDYLKRFIAAVRKYHIWKQEYFARVRPHLIREEEKKIDLPPELAEFEVSTSRPDSALNKSIARLQKVVPYIEKWFIPFLEKHIKKKVLGHDDFYITNLAGELPGDI